MISERNELGARIPPPLDRRERERERETERERGERERERERERDRRSRADRVSEAGARVETAVEAAVEVKLRR